MKNEQWKMENKSVFWMMLREALLAIAAFTFGFAVVFLFRRLFPAASTFHLIPASLTIDLAGISVLLMLLPPWDAQTQSMARRWQLLRAWLKASLLGAVAMLGMALAPWHAESARTFYVLAALFCGQCAMLTAVYGLLSVLLSPAPQAARQITLLLLGAATTALLWSRGAIQAAEQASPENGGQRAEVLADSVMRFSPPAAIAAAWYVESDAARKRGAVFDIVLSPLSYKNWVGSMFVMRPEILPPGLRSHPGGEDGFNPGVALAMLAFGMPVLLLCDLLLRRKPE
jgi:hypothetical protein